MEGMETPKQDKQKETRDMGKRDVKNGSANYLYCLNFPKNIWYHRILYLPLRQI